MICPLLLTSLLLSAPSIGDQPALLLDEPTPQWPWGPARYILKRREEEKYRALKALPERKAFIESFWQALDPTPETPFNEKRAEFWKRVNLANAQFQDSVKPGWKTDRGRIYILLGPPNELRRVGYSDLWTYRSLPLPNTPPVVSFRFFRSRSGEFSLSRSLAGGGPRMVGSKGSYLGASPISVGFDIGSAQIVPGRILLPETGVTTQYFFPILHPVDSYRTYRAADGSTLLVMELVITPDQFQSDFNPDAPLSMTLSASLSSESEGAPVSRFIRTLTLDSQQEGGPDRSLHFQTGIDLPPGRYHGEFTLLEQRTHLGALFTRTLTVPDYRQGLSLSSVTVSRPPKPSAESASLGSAASPWFSSGDSDFANGETLYFSYQVYNATQRADHAELDVEYRFFLSQGMAMQAVGRAVQIPGVEKESIGYALRLSDWPEGDYVIQVMVTDRPSGATAFREVAFRVVAAEAAARGADEGAAH